MVAPKQALQQTVPQQPSTQTQRSEPAVTQEQLDEVISQLQKRYNNINKLLIQLKKEKNFEKKRDIQRELKGEKEVVNSIPNYGFQQIRNAQELIKNVAQQGIIPLNERAKFLRLKDQIANLKEKTGISTLNYEQPGLLAVGVQKGGQYIDPTTGKVFASEAAFADFKAKATPKTKSESAGSTVTQTPEQVILTSNDKKAETLIGIKEAEKRQTNITDNKVPFVNEVKPAPKAQGFFEKQVKRLEKEQKQLKSQPASLKRGFEEFRLGAIESVATTGQVLESLGKGLFGVTQEKKQATRKELISFIKAGQQVKEIGEKGISFIKKPDIETAIRGSEKAAKAFFDIGKAPQKVQTAVQTTGQAVGITATIGGAATISALKGGIQIAKAQPARAVGFITGEILTGKAIAKGFSVAGDVFDIAKARLNKNFVPLTKDVETGKDVLKVSPEKKITITGGTSSVEESLARQAKLAGKKIDAVSAQRSLFDKSTDVIKVDKPKPTPDASELERSFFADPRSRLRTTRLGISQPKTADLADVLSGDVTLKPKEVPQALFFPDETVQSFPKNLKGVERKLLQNKAISADEARRLQEFQLRTSGQFKPVGFLSRESEVTLAPGELIVKERKIGETLIRGQGRILPSRVELFEVGIRRGEKIDEFLKSVPEERIRIAEVSQFRATPRLSLSEILSRTGISAGRVSAQKISQAISSVKISGAVSKNMLSGVSESLSSSSVNTSLRTSSASPEVITGSSSISGVTITSGASNITSSGSPNFSSSIVKRSSNSFFRTEIISEPTQRPIAKLKFDFAQSPAKQQGYDAYIKEKGKETFFKANEQPLTKRAAQAFAAEIVDESSARSWYVKPTAGKPVEQGIPSVFLSGGKFRPAKNQADRERGIFVERTQFLIDTLGEKQQITAKGLLTLRQQRNKERRKGFSFGGFFR